LGGEFSPFCVIFFYIKGIFYDEFSGFWKKKKKVSKKNLKNCHNLPNSLQHERVLIIFLFFIFLGILPNLAKYPHE
jgi:hypothetical protein